MKEKSDLIVGKIIHPGTVIFCGEPEFVGVMPVLRDVEALPPRGPESFQPSRGWQLSNITSVSVVNPPETPGQRQLRWATNMLECRLVERDGTWALMRAPYKDVPTDQSQGCIRAVAPDYDRIAEGTVVLTGSKHNLEELLATAETIVEFYKHESGHPGLFKKLRRVVGL